MLGETVFDYDWKSNQRTGLLSPENRCNVDAENRALRIAGIHAPSGRTRHQTVVSIHPDLLLRGNRRSTLWRSSRQSSKYCFAALSNPRSRGFGRQPAVVLVVSSRDQPHPIAMYGSFWGSGSRSRFYLDQSRHVQERAFESTRHSWLPVLTGQDRGAEAGSPEDRFQTICANPNRLQTCDCERHH